MAPLAPYVASRLEKRELKVEKIIDTGAALFERYDAVLVEGVGGLAVPINETDLIIDLITKLGLPIVIISRSGLGTINHTLITINYAQSHEIPILGVIFNGYRWSVPNEINTLEDIHALENNTNSELTNSFVVHKFSGEKILGRIPHVPISTSLQEQISILNSHVQIETILAALIP